jgi:EIN3-binding F-box protein
MTPDSDEDDFKTKGKTKKKGKGSTTNIGPKVSVGSAHTPGFRLRNEPPSSQVQPISDRNDDLDTLVDLFGSAFPTDIIQDILQACGGNQEAAMEALLAMSTPLDKQTTAPAAPAPAAADYAPLPTSPPHNLLPNLWDTIPQECKLLILEHLSLKDLSKAAATSKEFRNHVRCQRQSLRSITVPPGISTSSLRSLVTAFSAATAVDFSRCGKTLRFPNDFEDVAVAVAAGAANRPCSTSATIESISFAKCFEITDGDVAAILSVLGSLKAVNLSKCGKISDGALRTLARYQRRSDVSKEEEVGGDAEEEEDDTVDNEINKLTTSLDQTRLETPAAAVDRIADLASSRRQQQQQQAVATATATAHGATRNPSSCSVGGGLEELNLSGTEITTRGVTELLRGSGRAQSLLSLDVSRCSKISGDALVPGPRSMLRVLRASGCPAIHSITLQLANTSSCLRELSLANCKSLREVIISAAPSLVDLNVSGCTQLTTLSLRCPNLIRLLASGCARLHIGTFNGSLFECPSLQEVNFFGCRSLESANFESVLPLLVSVEELHLSGCVGLSRIVAVEGQGLRKLRKLMVDGCAVLRTIAVSSTELKEVSARACTRLMQVSLIGSVPRRLNLENCVELREVSLGGGGETRDGREEVEKAAVSGAVAEEVRQKLVLRGCDSLAPIVKDRLRLSVLKSS